MESLHLHQVSTFLNNALSADPTTDLSIDWLALPWTIFESSFKLMLELLLCRQCLCLWLSYSGINYIRDKNILLTNISPLHIYRVV